MWNGEDQRTKAPQRGREVRKKNDKREKRRMLDEFGKDTFGAFALRYSLSFWVKVLRPGNRREELRKRRNRGGLGEHRGIGAMSKKLGGTGKNR